jgi:chromosome segregation ATPase
VPALQEEQLQALQRLYNEQMEAANKAHAEVAVAREELTSILADMDQRHEEHDAEIQTVYKQLTITEEQLAAEAAQRENLEARLAAAVQEREEQRTILNATQAKLRAAEAERDLALVKVSELEALLTSSGQDAVQLQAALDAADFKLVQLAAAANAPQNALSAPIDQSVGAESSAALELSALDEADIVMQQKAELETELATVRAKMSTLEAELTVATDGVQRVSESEYCLFHLRFTEIPWCFAGEA